MAQAPRTKRPPSAATKPRAPSPRSRVAGATAVSSPVHDALVAAIMAGHLPAGAKLSEDAIGRIFDVSRTLVREALRQLASIGLVTVLPNRGAYVAAPDAAEAEHLYAARRLIELEIVADVARHCTAHDIRRLRQHVARQQASYDSQDRGAYIHCLGEFHIVLAGIGGSPVLAELVAQLVPRSALLTTLFSGPGPQPCAIDEHTTLIDLLAQGDVAGSVAAMRRHLTVRSHSLEFQAARPANVDFSAALAAYVPRHGARIRRRLGRAS